MHSKVNSRFQDSGKAGEQEVGGGSGCRQRTPLAAGEAKWAVRDTVRKSAAGFGVTGWMRRSDGEGGGGEQRRGGQKDGRGG